MSKNPFLQKILRRLPFIWRQIVFLFHDIPRYRQKIKYHITTLFAGFSYLFVKSDFVLRIGCLSKRHKKQSQNYFPPPAYGIPPGRKISKENLDKDIDKNQKKDKEPPQYSNYSLFLWPGSLSQKLWLYILVMFPVALLPLLNPALLKKLQESGKNQPSVFSSSEIFTGSFSGVVIISFILVLIFLPEVKIFAKNIFYLIRDIANYIHFFFNKFWKKWLKIIFIVAIISTTIYWLLNTIFNLGNILNIITSWWVFLCTLVTISALAIFIFRRLFHTIPPVLFKTWSKWPESQYGLFLNVPHKVDLTLQDYNKKRNKYWDPDTATPASQQALHYAQDRHSLQEVILNLALFDFLFRKKSEIVKEGAKNSLYSSVKMDNWLRYFLSPVWISYGLLLLMLFGFLFILPKDINECSDWGMLFNYPNNFSLAVIIWFLISYAFIQGRIKHLEVLYTRIHKGYYHSHLELVPQQILNDISQIPSQEQLSEAIEKMQTLLNYILIGALPSFLLLLEIFSNGMK